jgi:hypothetical protein
MAAQSESPRLTFQVLFPACIPRVNWKIYLGNPKSRGIQAVHLKTGTSVLSDIVSAKIPNNFFRTKQFFVLFE